MLKLYFFAVVDELTETVVNIFHARNFEHAKLIVKNSLKDADSSVTQFFKLVKISDQIEIDNDFDDIIAGSARHVDMYGFDYSLFPCSDFLDNSKKES